MSVAGTLQINAVANVDKATAGLNKLHSHIRQTAPAMHEAGEAPGLERLGEKLEHIGLHALGLNRHLIGLVTHFGPIGIAAAGAFYLFEKAKEQSEKIAKEWERIENATKEVEKNVQHMETELAQFGMTKAAKEVDNIRRELEKVNDETMKANQNIPWYFSKDRRPVKDAAELREELAKVEKVARELEELEKKEKAIKSVETYRDKIREAVETEGMTKGGIELWKLKAEAIKIGGHALEEFNRQQKNHKEWADALDAVEKRKEDKRKAEEEQKKKLHEIESERLKDQAKANQLLDESLTKEEKYQKKLDEINSLQRRHFLTEEQERKMAAAAKTEFEKEDREKAQRAADQAKKQQEEQAKRIIEESLNKEEKLAAKIKEVNDNTILKQDQKEKAIAKLKEDFEKDKEKEKKDHHKEEFKFGGGALLSSEAGRSAVLKAMFADHSGKHHVKKLADAAHVMAEAVKKQTIIVGKRMR